MVIKWQDKEFKLLNTIEINKSSREVTYTDIIVDFRKGSMNDLPLYLQESKIIDKNNNVLFTGYINNCQLPELNNKDSVKKELTLSLLSPRGLATKKTVTVIATDTIKNIISKIIAPLLSEKFILKEYYVSDRKITVKFIGKTVEECLNLLSNKYSIYWNIDELKNITINDIEYQFNKSAKKSIDILNYKSQLNGLISLTPQISGYDYANVINIKNARIFYILSSTYEERFDMQPGDEYIFENPIDISQSTAERIVDKRVFSEGIIGSVNPITIEYGSESAYIYYGFNGDNAGIHQEGIGTEDSSGELFILKMDSTFKNLATGFKYKGSSAITVTRIYSDTCLRYANMKLYNWNEIEKNAGKITNTGEIEKTVDVNSKWFTVDELIEYIKSLFIINNNYTNTVKIICDKENDLLIGDRVEFNLPEYFIEGNFIITSIHQSKTGNNPFVYNYELKNTNLLENFIDLFRSTTTEEQESQIELEYIVEYIEEEKIVEKNIIEKDI